MTKEVTFGRMLAGAGAIAMAIAPIAAQAGTRAADAQTVSVKPVTMAPVSRASKSAEKKSEIGGSSVLIAVLAAAAVIAGIVVAASDDDDADLSPGT